MGWYQNSFICVIFFIAFVFTAGCTSPPQQSGEYQYNTPYSVTVVSVTDGDTVHVTMPDGTLEVVRLLGIDTPEKSADDNKPGEYGSIQDMSYLALFGAEATRYTTDTLNGTRVKIMFDEDAGLRDRYGRLLAYLTCENKEDFNANLVSDGYARVYTEETFTRKSLYQDLQNVAQMEGLGLWHYAEEKKLSEPAGVYILDVVYDAAGNDLTNLNGEEIILANAGDSPLDLGEWQVKESEGVVYTFNGAIIPGHGRLVLHSGFGDDTMTDKYWNLKTPVLGNDGDNVALYDINGVLVSSFAW